jgi:hypothetical protein
MPADYTSSFENYCRERKAMMDRARHSTEDEGATVGRTSSKRATKEAYCTELLEVISHDEKATAATQPLTPMASHSWSLSSNSIILKTYPGDLLDPPYYADTDQQEEEEEREEARHDCDDTKTSRQSVHGSPAKKSILSYSSDSSGLFSPLYEVTSANVNVFQSTRKPLPKAGKTPRFGNLSYKQVAGKNAGDSLKTERTSNASQHFYKTPSDTLSFDFSMERPRTPGADRAEQCSTSHFSTTCSDVTRREIAKSIGPVRTFEAFMRGEWQLDRISLPSKSSSSTEAQCGQPILDTSVDTNDENRIEGRIDSPTSTCLQPGQFKDDPELLDAIIEVKDSVDRNGNAVIVLREICPKTFTETTSTKKETHKEDLGSHVMELKQRNKLVIDLTDCADSAPKPATDRQKQSHEGNFGVDVMELKRRNKSVIDLTCCTDSEVLSFTMPYRIDLTSCVDSEALSFKMPHQTKYEQILSAQRQLSYAETPRSYVYNILSDTSHYLKWDRVPLQGKIGSTKHPLLVLSEHFREMSDMTQQQLAKARLTPNHHEVLSPGDIMQHFNDRFKGWSIQRTKLGTILVYQGDEYSSSGSVNTESATMHSRSIECSSEIFVAEESTDKEKVSGGFDSEVIDDMELRAVMKITNDGEDVSFIFPAISFDTIDEAESDDGLGYEMEALLGLQTQLRSAMHVATTLTPTRFPLELTSPFAEDLFEEDLYSKDSSMASFGEVAENTENSSGGVTKCKRGRRRLPRCLKVQFNDDIQEILYVSEINDGENIPNRRKAYARKRSFIGEFLGICQDVAEELSFSCIALSGICSNSSRTKASQRPTKKKR